MKYGYELVDVCHAIEDGMITYKGLPPPLLPIILRGKSRERSMRRALNFTSVKSKWWRTPGPILTAISSLCRRDGSRWSGVVFVSESGWHSNSQFGCFRSRNSCSGVNGSGCKRQGRTVSHGLGPTLENRRLFRRHAPLPDG